MKQQHPTLGFFLALNTAMFWGAQPIIMKQILGPMEPVTVIWYRFGIAAICLGLILGAHRKLPKITTFTRRQWLLFATATIGLTGNFVMFLSSLQFISPTASQVLGQLGPMLLLITSIIILKERMHRSQVFGAIILITGIILFFNQNLREIFTHLDNYTLGIILGTSAALVWSLYGLSQKVLSRNLTSQQVLWLVYLLCAIVLFPAAKPLTITHTNTWQFSCLILCCINTLVAYGSFAEALAIWQAAKVGAVLSLTPLFTLLFSDSLHSFLPHLFESTILNWIGYVGAILVVSGTTLSVLGHMWRLFRLPKQAHLNQPPPSL